MRRIADLLEHPALITIQCDCTRVIDARPQWFLSRLGPEATVEDAERRLICNTCKKRPRLTPRGEHGVTGGRDRRVNPPPMPSWVSLR